MYPGFQIKQKKISDIYKTHRNTEYLQGISSWLRVNQIEKNQMASFAEDVDRQGHGGGALRIRWVGGEKKPGGLNWEGLMDLGFFAS